MCLGLAGYSVGIFLGSMFNDAKTASGLMPLFVLPFMLFSGFFADDEGYFIGIRWIKYLSPFKYGFDLLL